MGIKDLPADYTVAYIDGQWHPVLISRRYSAEYPNGYILLYTTGGTFRTQHEAIECCQRDAEFTECLNRHDWERLAARTDVYPERCAHYADIIKQYRGHEPIITRSSREVFVFVPSGYCPDCKMWLPGVSEAALLIENALARAAESVYACRCLCEREQEERLQLVA